MKRNVLVLGAFCVALVGGGVSLAQDVGNAPSGSRQGVVTEPIAKAKAHADPDKAARMNKRNPKLAEGVAMRKVTPVDAKQLIGKGRGDGCHKHYGEAGQCLPIAPPSHDETHMDHAPESHPWTCAEVRTIFADGVPLAKGGADPLKLDSNKDRVACNAGDA